MTWLVHIYLSLQIGNLYLYIYIIERNFILPNFVYYYVIFIAFHFFSSKLWGSGYDMTRDRASGAVEVNDQQKRTYS